MINLRTGGRWLLLAGVISYLVLALSPTAHAAVIQVDINDPDCIPTGAGPAYCSIQDAIDVALPGDTVSVASGTYVENLYIDKDITLSGVGADPVVEAPVTIPTCFTTATDKHPVICVENTTAATVEYMSIDGAGNGNSNVQFMGIAFHNAGGTVQESSITGIRDTPFSGAQHGVAIYSYNEDTTGRTINIWNNHIEAFQKNAMALNAKADTPLAIDVRLNRVIGAGATTVTAQNGIQAWGEQITGYIDGNTVSGIAYDNANDPGGWVASSILTYFTQAVHVTDNTIFGGHVGIYNVDSAGALSGNRITIDKVGVSAYGIVASDPPEAVPSPFGDAGTLREPRSEGSGEATALAVDVTDNFVLFHGPENSATYGIEADAGFGPDDLALSAWNNVVRGFDIGFELYECISDCDSGVFAAVTANNNCIEHNHTGMRSNLTVPAGDPVSAELNWWGSSSGPGPVGAGDPIDGNIDYTPWQAASNCGPLVPGDWLNLTSGAYYATLQDALDDAVPGDEVMATGKVRIPGRR